MADNLQAPRFNTQPSASGSIVAVGRTKILQCQALGFPQPQYRWLKDGDYISGFSSEHFYKIQSVTRPDAGSYQCIARNSVGSIISEMIPLSVAFMTSFSETGPSVTWQSEDNTLLYGTKYATTADNKLVILNVDQSDTGRGPPTPNLVRRRTLPTSVWKLTTGKTLMCPLKSLCHHQILLLQDTLQSGSFSAWLMLALSMSWSLSG